jgi:hypothetical protein
VFAAGGLPSHYRVQWQVPVRLFQLFLEAVNGNDIQITSENSSGLSQLCEEFGFGSLSSKLSAFRACPSFRDSVDADARSHISVLEESDSQQERRLAALEAKLSQVAQLPLEVARMQADLERVISELQTALPQLRAFSEAAPRQLSREVARLQSEISGCKRSEQIMCACATLKPCVKK